MNETVFYFESGLLDSNVMLQAINNEELHVSAVENDDRKVGNGFQLFYIIRKLLFKQCLAFCFWSNPQD